MKSDFDAAAYRKKIERFKDALKNAEAVLVGAGAGLSAAAGFTYSGKRFLRYFSDFYERYGFTDMYSGGFYPYKTLEEFWAYWSRYVHCNRYSDPPKPLYDELFSLVKEKNYFVLTTNVDHCFQRAGFSKERLLYTQGDFGLFQCSKPCHSKTYDNENAVKSMLAAQKDMKIPSELIPLCPVCGSPMSMNLRADETFVEDEGWHAASSRYEAFVEKFKDSRLLLMELGVGYNTPGIIKYPFWQMTAANPKSVLISVNSEEDYIPEEISDRAVSFKGDLASVIGDMTAER
ncbi:Sir2 silent information regulator family NAD-dependent deacetylase [Treponema parvum]|uniref:Sir2 silent information regulator family NAD-dependent deacetylase n=1 Tax=Treponema parvum TaxID=138851 RepID=A0A975IEQ1_9SPIR|nr:Sir2 silent information regulator family NAD-dependent deacetylase [Treponema parvum]QTQ14295.1 Sir2 silent information regulator family NAD-dependent deacetylase [Treponema parvum]